MDTQFLSTSKQSNSTALPPTQRHSNHRTTNAQAVQTRLLTHTNMHVRDAHHQPRPGSIETDTEISQNSHHLVQKAAVK